jgi:hypothetical protein
LQISFRSVPSITGPAGPVPRGSPIERIVRRRIIGVTRCLGTPISIWISDPLKPILLINSLGMGHVSLLMVVCTESYVGVDDAPESPKLAE